MAMRAKKAPPSLNPVAPFAVVLAGVAEPVVDPVDAAPLEPVADAVLLPPALPALALPVLLPVVEALFALVVAEADPLAPELAVQ